MKNFVATMGCNSYIGVEIGNNGACQQISTFVFVKKESQSFVASSVCASNRYT